MTSSDLDVLRAVTSRIQILAPSLILGFSELGAITDRAAGTRILADDVMDSVNKAGSAKVGHDQPRDVDQMGTQGRGCGPRVEGAGEGSDGARQVAGNGPQGQPGGVSLEPPDGRWARAATAGVPPGPSPARGFGLSIHL